MKIMRSSIFCFLTPIADILIVIRPSLLILLFSIQGMFSFKVTAGNPDRQGEAGAYELTINPWARAAALHSMHTSMVWGVEAMWHNPAGLSKINKSEYMLGHMQ